MGRGVSLLVVAALLLAAPSVHAQAPSNDTAAGAAPLPLNQPVSGDLGPATNDYELSGSTCFGGIGQTAVTAGGKDAVFRFVAPSAGAYDFRQIEPNTATNPVLYVATALPDGAGPATVTTCLAAANRNTSQAAEEVTALTLAAGQQVLVVADSQAGTDSPSPFTLVVERTVLGESEANDTPGTADARLCGTTGRIDSAGDVDFWSIGGQPAGTRLFALVDGAAAAGSAFDLRATTATDTLEFDDSDGAFHHGTNAPLLAHTTVGNTPSYLRVNNDNAGAANEPYRLYSVLRSGFANAESEPNDTPAAADPSPAGWVTGALASTADADVFTFSAPARGLMFIALDGDPARTNTPLDGSLELLDANGNSLLLVDDSNAASNTTSGAGSLTSTTPNSPAEAMAVRLPSAGTYYVRVSTALAAGNYVLSMSYNCRAGAPPAPIALTPSSLSGASQGVGYSQALTASGGVGPHSFAVSSGSLPTGLALAGDGTLAGTPTQAGAFNFTVVATDGDEAAGERPYTLDVAAAPTPPALGPDPGAGAGPGPGPGQGATPADTDPPQTRITKKPKKKLRARRVAFKFSSDEAGSKFQCKFDRKAFGSCRSPKKYAVKPGKHTFQVRATDSAGNVDRSPAKYAFRVLRPKRR